MRDKDFDIKNPKKKFQKTERVPPEGYECANDFFEDMYMDKDMIWMGQNTNHLHDDTIANAMIEAIKENTGRHFAHGGHVRLPGLLRHRLLLSFHGAQLSRGGYQRHAHPQYQG